MIKELIAAVVVLSIVVAGGVYVAMQKKGSTPIRDQGEQNTSLTPASSGTQNTSISGQPEDKNMQEATNEISLNITSHTDNQIVTSSNITIKGMTSPGADVSINDMDLKADPEGVFSKTITLDEGANTIIIVAIDPEGKSAERDLTITYDTGTDYQ